MTNPDFVSARRAALAAAHWQCPTCGSFYPTGATCGGCAQAALQSQCRLGGVVIRVDDPVTTFCGSCGRTKATCDADARGCGSGAATSVSLPAAPVVERAPAPLLSDWCDKCGWAKAYCKGH